MQQKPFRYPVNLEPSKQLEFAVSIIEKHRQEAKLLRQTTTKAKSAQKRLEKELERWKEKYQKSQEELKKVKKENGKLKQEIEKITKTKERYRVSLFDHGNFKSQKEVGDKKPKGGQLGHQDTNREHQAHFDGYDSFDRKRIYAKNCGKCGAGLKRVASFKEKLLLDIKINPEVIKLIIESERQWCGSCKGEVNAKDSQTLPFSEYGLNTFMMVMILRHKAHCSMSVVVKIIQIGFGLKLCASDVSNLLKTAAKYLDHKYEELKQAVRDGEVMYCDETGWQVKKQRAWMWIMATDDKLNDKGEVKGAGITVYVAAESRGKGIAEEIYGNSHAYCMTDGLYSYLNTIPRDHHLYCWAHVLRFAYEETVNSLIDSKAVFLRDELVRIYHIKSDHPELEEEQLEQNLKKQLDQLLLLESEEESFVNIQNRLKDQQEGLIKALVFTKSGTNNLAERELRVMAITRNISYGSNTFTGMETTAVIGSVIQTISRNPKLNVLTEIELDMQIGIHQKYPQYKHLPFNST